MEYAIQFKIMRKKCSFHGFIFYFFLGGGGGGRGWGITPQSTAMVMLRSSIHLTIWSCQDGQFTYYQKPRFFLGKLEEAVNQYFVHIHWLVTDNNPSSISWRRRMALEIISWSISTKVWGQAGIKLATPGSAVELATDCATGPVLYTIMNLWKNKFITYYYIFTKISS